MARNVFFIDDSESMQKAVSTIFLDNLDFNLNSVHDPSSLLETAKDFRPDIVILSYNSINTEIKQNISEIKNSESLSGVPLILLVPSDLSDNERELFIKQGISGFIYRPFEKDIFLSKIKRALGVTDERDRVIMDTEKTGNKVLQEETDSKIYDISSFETNDEGKDDMDIQKIVPDMDSPEPSKSTIDKEANSDNTINDIENNPADASVAAGNDSGSDNKGNAENIDSAELSQAFENLFKDDAIFKEFQDINENKDSPFNIDKPEIKEGFDIDGTTQEDMPEIQPIAPEPEKTMPEDLPPAPIEITKATDEQDIMPEPEKTIQEDILKIQPVALEPIPEPEPELESEPTPEPELEDLSPAPIEITKATDEQNDKEMEVKQEVPAQNIEEFSLPADNNPIILEEPKNIEDTKQYETLTEGGFKLEILDEQNLVKLDESLRNSIQKIMEEIKPEIVENIKGMLPDIVEKLIKEEIEKIKSAAASN